MKLINTFYGETSDLLILTQIVHFVSPVAYPLAYLLQHYATTRRPTKREGVNREQISHVSYELFEGDGRIGDSYE
jgi:hypothetical protein